MKPPQTSELRLTRTDYELMQLGLAPTTKGEAIERLFKVELEPHTEAKFTKGKIQAKDGALSAECDLIAYRGELESTGTTPIVPAENALCVIEVKTDLSLSALENGVNDWINTVREQSGVPVFLASIRHSNTREELQRISTADVTVACAALREQKDAEAMAHSGEVDRLIDALQRATANVDD